MKLHETLRLHTPYVVAATSLDSDYAQQSLFSDSDILTLQEKFLTSGFHYVTVHNRAFGRAFVDLFLSSLNHFTSSACVTLGDVALPDTITDVYQELLLGGFVTENGQAQAMDDFFVDDFYHDFVWVEACEELQAAPWFEAFENKLRSLQEMQDLPVIVISYHE
jgi:hypothetical protein